MPADGRYDINVFSQHHENRATAAPITVKWGESSRHFQVDQTVKRTGNFTRLDTFSFQAGDHVKVVFDTKDAGGTVHIDAVQLLPLPSNE